MSFYQKMTAIGKRLVSYHLLFKYGFNWSPMYRRSTGRVHTVSKDLSHITIKIPLSWKNKNYVGTIFGGSMFSAVDPIPMVQLINLLDDNYVVWDKSATIKFKRPAKETLYGEFSFSEEELDSIKNRVKAENEIEIVKSTVLTNKDRTMDFCVVDKTLYIADKTFYKKKRQGKSKLVK
ncbi:MAG: DUF4442 domain-containing protein [Bacteroidota bacterium]